MSLRLSFDEANWVELPAEFPADGARDRAEWIDRVVDRMRGSWPGGLEAEANVREALGRGLDAVRPEDSATLQYWPWYGPLAAVVHLVDGVFAEGDDGPAYLLGTGPLVAAPVAEVVTAARLGDGVEVRLMTRPEGVTDDVAGLTQLYVSGSRFVGVGVDATAPLLLLALLPELRDLMDSVEALDGVDAPTWVRSTVAEDALPGPGEVWPLETEAIVPG